MRSPRFRAPWLAGVLAALVLPVAAQESAVLRPVPAPSLEAMEPAVRGQLVEARNAVDALVEETGEGVEPKPGSSPPALAAIYGRLGQLYLLYELYEAADAAFANAQALAPNDFQWPYYRGAVAEETGRLEDAAGYFGRSLELRPAELPTLLHLAQVELDRNRTEAAAGHFRRALELDQASAAALQGLGEIAFLAGRYGDAVEHFEAALALQPQATAVHYQLALAHRQLGDLEAAREHLALRGDEPARFRDPLIQFLSRLGAGSAVFMARGNAAFDAGDLERAVAEYRRAVEANPDDPLPRQALASALGRTGRAEEAIAEYRRLLEGPAGDGAVVHYNLATLLIQRGEIEEALRHFHRAVELAPDFADAHFNLGTTYEGLERWEEAAERFSRVLELDLQDQAARLRRARILDRIGRSEEAESELAALAEGDPANPEIQLALGNLLGRLGRFRQAAEHLDRAVELAPGHEEAHFGRAMALLLGGLEREAAERLAASAEALPESVPVLHLLARLRATSSDPEVRDGERAVALARRVLELRPALDHAETLAMALAEAGRFEDAAGVQRQVLERARASGRGDLAAQAERLAAYERGEAVRSPWKRQP